MKEEKLISIIIPVYNAHGCLKRCVDSILEQTYSNIELLLVDDGSTDDSYEICKKYEQFDSRVHAYTKKNGGQASARNFALEHVKGEYLTFVDNDDWCEPEMCYNLLHLALRYNADIVGGAEYTGDFANKSEEIEVYSMKEYANLLLPDTIGSHVLAHLFKKELFADKRFPYSKTVEDMRLFTRIIRDCSVVVKTKSELYHYTIHENNTSFRYAQTPASSLDRAQAFLERYDVTRELCSEKLPIIMKKAVSFGIGGIGLITSANKEIYVGQLSEIRSFYKWHLKEILLNKEIDVLRKTAVVIFLCFGEKIFSIPHSIFKKIKDIFNF